MSKPSLAQTPEQIARAAGFVEEEGVIHRTIEGRLQQPGTWEVAAVLAVGGRHRTIEEIARGAPLEISDPSDFRVERANPGQNDVMRRLSGFYTAGEIEALLCDMRAVQKGLDAQLAGGPEPFEDGEVLGLDKNGAVVQWNAQQQAPYNCGETLETFGVENLRPHERARVGLFGEAVPAPAAPEGAEILATSLRAIMEAHRFNVASIPPHEVHAMAFEAVEKYEEGRLATRLQVVSAAEFAKTHRCDPDWVAAMGAREVVVLPPGLRGTYSGFEATVQEHYCNGMYNIALPSGKACVSGTDFVPEGMKREWAAAVGVANAVKPQEQKEGLGAKLHRKLYHPTFTKAINEFAFQLGAHMAMGPLAVENGPGVEVVRDFLREKLYEFSEGWLRDRIGTAEKKDENAPDAGM